LPSVTQVEDFCTKHIRDQSGRPFSLEGREWVRDQFWAPALGFKFWPVNPKKLCDACKAKANTITEWLPDNPTKTKAHRKTGCEGLDLKHIAVVVVRLKRRAGKTFNFGGLANALGFMLPHQHMTYAASAEDAAGKLFKANFSGPIQNNPKLKRNAKIVGNKITYKTGSTFEFVPTSVGAAIGLNRTLVAIDECREVTGEFFMALAQTVLAEHGFECPHGHVHYVSGAAPDGRTCSTCQSALQPWHATVVAMSSAGELKDSDKGTWFVELAEQLKKEPHPHMYVFDENIDNPLVDLDTRNAYAEVFGKVDSMRHLVDVEIHNIDRRKGEDFLSQQQIEACVDGRLTNAVGVSDRACVAFLDASQSIELTSLVIVSDDSREDDTDWSRLRVERIDVWEPKKMPRGLIDERVIQKHLDEWIPRFPTLVALEVDARGMPWAARLVDFCRNERKPWGKYVTSYRGKRIERAAAFRLLEQHILAETITYPPNKFLLKELSAARRFASMSPDIQVEVREANRKRNHLDVVESLAMCCHRAHMAQLAGARRSLASVQGRITGKKMIDAIYKSHVRGLGMDSF